MKKLFWFFFSISLLITAAFTTSCFLQDDDEDKVVPIPAKVSTTPVIRFADSTYLISGIPTDEYIAANIIRMSAEDEKFESNVTTVIIGQTVPASGKYLTAVEFKDPFTDSSKYYKYGIRYFDGEKYSIPMFSKIFKGLGTKEAELTPTEASVTYMKNTYTVKLNDALSIPDDFSSAYILLKKKEETTPVLLAAGLSSSIASGTESSSLRNILSTDFQNTPLTPTIIVAVKAMEDSSTYFTTPAKLTLKVDDGTSEEDAETFTVPSESNSGDSIYY